MMFPNFLIKIRFLSLLALILITPSTVFAGSGTVNGPGPNQGEIDFTVKFLFPPDADVLDGFRQAVIEASAIICEATEGQMRFGTVTITGGSSVNNDLVDMFVHPQDGRANANVCFNDEGIPCYALEIPGARTNIYTDQFLSLYYDPFTIAHEMGHLALDLGDEYDEQSRSGACWGIGRCIESGQIDAVNTCLMQGEYPGFPGAPPFEFCVASNHDDIQGDPLTPVCTDPESLNCPPPCDTNCQYWNSDTCSYEMTQQTAYSLTKFGMILDCWSHLNLTHSFVTPPADLPSTGSPVCNDPTFVGDFEAIDQVVLVLDRSFSMRLLPGQGPCAGAGCPEICNNDIDDDGDGMVDEVNCQNNRLDFVKSTATLFLNLVKGSGTIFDPITVDAGMVSFQCTTKDLTEGLLGVSNNSIQNVFSPLITDLKPNGNTAIGNALSAALGMFPGGDELSPNRAIFLLTDGFNNCGTLNPVAMTGLLEALGTRVFMITTEDGNDDVLGSVAGATQGRAMHTTEATDLMPAMALQVARHLNSGLLIPKLAYRVATTGQFEKRRDSRGATAWFDNKIQPQNNQPLTTPTHQSNFFEFLVEPGTSEVTFSFAGDMNTMGNFGIRAKFFGPAGPNPTFFDSAGGILPPQLIVVKEAFYTLVTIQKPNPGQWWVNLTSLDPAGPGQIQTGFVTALTKNQRVAFVTSLDRYVVDQPGGGPVLLSAFPSFDTDLSGATIRCRVYWPDGTVVNLPVEDHTDKNAGYLVRIDQMPLAGEYEVRLVLETNPGVTKNNPGESIFASSPSVEVAVPKMIRTAVETFRVQNRKTSGGSTRK